MTAEDAQSIKTAIALRYGYANPCCGNCDNASLMTKNRHHASVRTVCLLREKSVEKDAICRKYSPKKLKGKRAEIHLTDEISTVTDRLWKRFNA